MEVSARRAFALLKSLAFERLSGSDAEKCAAETLLAEAQGCGVDAHIEEFSVPCGRVGSARLVVTAPYQKEYAVTGYERSLSTPEGGLDADFYYAEDLLPAQGCAHADLCPQCEWRARYGAAAARKRRAGRRQARYGAGQRPGWCGAGKRKTNSVQQMKGALLPWKYPLAARLRC